MERQGAGHRVFHVASAVSAYFQGGEEPRAKPRVLGVVASILQREGSFSVMLNALSGDSWPWGSFLLLVQLGH